MKSGSTKTINGQMKTRNLSGVKFNSIYCQLSRSNRGNERNAHHSTWPIRSSLTSSENTSLESSEAEDSSSETVGSNWYGSTSMFKVKKWLNQGKSDKNGNKNKTQWRQHAAKRWWLLGPTLTSLVSIFSCQSRGHLRNVFVKSSEMLGFWTFIFL